jgi:squalene-associated FAD-dependent desaturase
MSYDVVIIGGGLSGLTAAVDLSSRGLKILLLEQRRHLGGRAYSFVDETTGDVVDNGQHLMMGCYHETRAFLQTLGSDHLATLQKNLHIDFLHPVRGPVALHCPSLPAPFNVLAGLLKLSSLALSDRLRLMIVGKEILSTSASKERVLESMTVEEWLTSLGQSHEARKYLWDVIAIGTLNDDPKTVSALLFFRVLRAAFMGRAENSSLLIPRAGLSDLFAHPASKFIRSHGGAIRLGCNVSGINLDKRVVRSIRCSDGTSVTGRMYICSIPYFALSGLSGIKGEFPLLERFESSPIVTMNLWLDAMVVQQDLVALLDSRVQWIFNKTNLLGTDRSKADQYLSLVISGAGEYVNKQKNDLVKLAKNDLDALFPKARKANVLHSVVIKEKRATFSPKPGVESLRPFANTQFENLFLAGDWTKTGYPATIEGAVMSGRKAAREAERALGL